MNLRKDSGNDVLGMLKSSGIIKKIIRYLACMISSIVVTIFVEEVSTELLVLWYMRANQIVYRSDLSEDYGFGMLVFFSAILILIICFPLSLYITWKMLKKYYV